MKEVLLIILYCANNEPIKCEYYSAQEDGEFIYTKLFKVKVSDTKVTFDKDFVKICSGYHRVIKKDVKNLHDERFCTIFQ